jgi:glucokinase
MALVAGIDMGGTRVRIAVASLDGEILARSEHPTHADVGPESFVEHIAGELTRLAQRRGTGTIEAVAIGAPGPIDITTGLLINPPNLKGWKDVPLCDMLSARISAPVYLQNDANLACFGEYRRGAGRGTRNMIYMTISTGIGAGLILDGKLYSGMHGSAGEIGHMIVDPDGPVCNCGQRGCLEAIASGTAISKLAKQASKNQESTLSVIDLDAITAEVVAEHAKKGDKVSLEIFANAARALGIAFISVTNLLDPEKIILGGGLVHSWGLLRQTALSVLKSSPFITPNRRPLIEIAKLSQHSGLIGAVEWARDHVA